MISAEQLAEATGATFLVARNWLAPVQTAMDAFSVSNPARMAAFLANIGHESGRLHYVREIWGPTAAQLRYEGRKDLGNLRPGDGYRFLGRGLIQITGHGNYIAVRNGLRKYLSSVPDFEQSPVLLELPRWAAYSAAWFWAEHGCNALADAGDFDGCCDEINRGHKTEQEGDSNGFEQRLAFWQAGTVALA